MKLLTRFTDPIRLFGHTFQMDTFADGATLDSNHMPEFP